MPEVPKIVHDRLRTGLPGGTLPAASHPDPDVVTAFAEQALSAAEREAVLQHLAGCGTCRELVALSIPPMESGTQPLGAEDSEPAAPTASSARRKASRPRSWWAWSGWRWAALAAGIVVAGGILLIHPGKPTAVREAKQQPASTVARTDEAIVAKEAAAPSDSGLNTRSWEKKPVPAQPVLNWDKELKVAGAPAENAIARAQIEPSATSKDKDMAVSGAVGGAPASPAPVPQVPSASEVVEVTAASGPVITDETRIDLPVNGRQAAELPANEKLATGLPPSGGQAAALPPSGKQLAALPASERQVSDLAISKAKAAKVLTNEPSALQRSGNMDRKRESTDTTAQQQNAASAGMMTTGANLRSKSDQAAVAQFAAPPMQWAIHGNDLQRLLDSGAAWKTILHSDHPLLCYAARGNELWAGGKGGDLFHSANGGVTWNQLHPSVQGQTLSDDITHIEIYNPSQIVLSTSSNQSWSTADGGKTWVKK